MGDNDRRAPRAPPALNPEQLGLTQPWKDFVSRGLITSLEVGFTPGGTNVAISLSDQVPVPEGTSRDKLPPGMAKQYILDSGLASLKKRGQGNKETGGQPLPVRSLCAADADDVGKLDARIKAVAMKLGSSVALGRIGSLKMMIDGVQSFEDWWSRAKPDNKVKLVMDDKHWKTLTSEQASIILGKLEHMSSPFRGPLPIKSEIDEKKAEGKNEGEAPTKSKDKGKSKPSSKK